MYVVVVHFVAKPEASETFREVLLTQASNSLSREPGCRVFDVAVDEPAGNHFLLYEIYDDETTFQEHLKTEHFLDFDARSQAMFTSKEVSTHQLISDLPPRRMDG